ncbi:MAG: type II secretion system F family protein [Raoultibacter sp.]
MLVILAIACAAIEVVIACLLILFFFRQRQQRKFMDNPIMVLLRGEGGEDQDGNEKNKEGWLANKLHRAGISQSPFVFLTIWLMITFSIAGIGVMVGLSFVLVALLAVIGAFLPLLYLRSCEKKNLARFDAQLPNALDTIVSNLLSGFSIESCISTIAAEGPYPLNEEFNRMALELQYSSDTIASFKRMARRMKSDDLRLLAIIIEVSNGASMAAMVAQTAATIRERVELKDEKRALTSSGRFSGNLIAFLPIAVFVVLCFSNPSYMDTYFSTDFGFIVLAICVVLEVIGLLVIRRICTFD